MRINKTFLVFFLVLLFSVSSSYAQVQKKDSLIAVLHNFQKKPNFKKDTVYINSLYNYGKIFGHNNLDSLLLFANESIGFSKVLGYGKGEAQGYILLGNYNSEIGNQDVAIENFSKALSKSTEISNTKLILGAKSSLATEFIYKEEYTKALEEYLKGIDLAKKYKADNALSILYVNITVVYSILGDYEQCIYYLIKATELSKKLGDERLTGISLTNLASSYIGINDFSNGLAKLDESIPIFEKLELREWLCFAYELKAAIYIKQENFEKALFWFQKSHEIHNGIDQTRYKIPLFNGMAKAYLGLEDYKNTEKYALKGLEFSEKLNIIDERDEILQTLYQVKKITNNNTKALFYLEKFKAISDTINKKNNQKDLKILESTLKFKQKEEKYLIENEKQIIQQKLYFYAALLVVLTLAIIVFLLKRNNTIQAELNGKLTEKTVELGKQEKFLKNANNNKSKLFSIIAHDLRGPIGSFKSMLDLVGSGDIKVKELKGFLPQMRTDTNTIFFTLNNLLSWSRTQMNGSITTPSKNNTSLLVEENIKLLSKTADTKGITIINEIDYDTITWSDINQTGIVIRNLISNAIKFTPEKGQIIICAKETTNDWKFSFKDNGVGMNVETLDLVFNNTDPFTTRGTNNEIGTGLGLSLCQEMVEKNGGIIWAKSELGAGSCFYFTIPKKLS